MDKIVIFDFGSQTTQLIARRIREIGVYTDIVPSDYPVKNLIKDEGIKGIIISGSPYSVYEREAPEIDQEIYDFGVPILGICYGMHRIITDKGGLVRGLSTREYGRARISYREHSPLFENIPEGFVSWMSHGDSIQKIPENFSTIAISDNHIAAVSDNRKKIFGIQFHPEVSHCEYGKELLFNFSVKICGAEKNWNMDFYLERKIEEIQKMGSNKHILILISGGVDSTVAAGLLLKALPVEMIYLLYIDTGLMRKNETEEVVKNLKNLGAQNIHWVDAEDRFLSSLSSVQDPEKKREIIGDLFITIQEEEIKKLGIEDAMLVQGTLYTDLIESGKGIGKNAKVIKSHHNVRSPLVEQKRARGLIIEPLELLYKDEVRNLGKKLGISIQVVNRHPFPGPGLAVRILGEVTKEKCDILREADYILIEELKKRELYSEIWQAFCVLLPVRSVGVAGDSRKYGWVLCIRCVVSMDGMTADVYPFPMKHLLEISAIITNSVDLVGRVVYDISSKPPSTIEWE